MEKTSGQELSDLLYGLQMTVKILEGIMTEHKEGKRDQADYESRIHSQSNLLASNLKGVKPLTEKLFADAYSRFKNESAVSSVSKEDVQSKGSEAVVIQA
jgi:ABC-type Zn2+ transport system substrate-binding protein/surface adhesin